jgi:hypothetical protein
MSVMRLIDGSVLLSPPKGEGKPCRVQLMMFGDLSYLFVKLPYRTMESHLMQDGTLGMNGDYRWSDLQLGEAYRLDDSGSVVSVFDIARETAKRLGVI